MRIFWYLLLFVACVMIDVHAIVLNEKFVSSRNQKQLETYLQANAKTVPISFASSAVEKSAADKLQMSVEDLQKWLKWLKTGQKPGLSPSVATTTTPSIFKPKPSVGQSVEPVPVISGGGSSSSSSSAGDKATQLRQELAKRDLEKVWNTGTKKFTMVDDAFVKNYLNLSEEDKATFFDTVFDRDKIVDLNPFDIASFNPRIGKFSNEQVRNKFFENLTYYGPAEKKDDYEILVEEYIKTPMFVAPAVKPGQIPPPPPLPPVKKVQGSGESTLEESGAKSGKMPPPLPLPPVKKEKQPVASKVSQKAPSSLAVKKGAGTSGAISAGDLRKQVSQGKAQLKGAEEQLPLPVRSVAPVTLQDQIKMGKQLKNAGVRTRPVLQPEPTGTENMAGVMGRALDKRRHLIEGDLLDVESDGSEWN